MSPKEAGNDRRDWQPGMAMSETNSKAIVDQVDTVFVATLPEQTRELLDSLTFRDDQTIVSLAAMIPVEQLAETVANPSHYSRAAE